MIRIRTIVYDCFKPGDPIYPHSVWDNARFAWPRITDVDPIIRQYSSLVAALTEALKEPACTCSGIGCLPHYSVLFFGSRTLPTTDEAAQISQLLAEVPSHLQIILGFTHDVENRSGFELAREGVAVIYEVDGFQKFIDAVDQFIHRATRPAA